MTQNPYKKLRILSEEGVFVPVTMWLVTLNQTGSFHVTPIFLTLKRRVHLIITPLVNPPSLNERTVIAKIMKRPPLIWGFNSAIVPALTNFALRN